METYRIVFRGKQTDAYSNIPIETHLQKIHLPEPKIRRVISGKAVVLKEQLNLSQAKAFQKTLLTHGLKCELSLQLSPECLRHNLKRKTKIEPTSATTKKSSNSTSSKTSTVVHVIYQNFVHPTLVSPPKTYTITEPRGKTVLHIRSHRFQWSPLALLIFSILLGLTLESYIVRYLSSALGLQTTATILGLASLIVIIILLPKLTQPLGYFTLIDPSQKSSLHCADRQSIMMGSLERDVFDQHGNKKAIIRRTATLTEYIDTSDRPIYRWNAALVLTSSSEHAIKNIQNGVIEDTIIEQTLSYIDSVKQVIHFFIPKPKMTQVKWESQPASPVIDRDGRVVALVYTGKYAAYTITAPELRTDLQLVLMCINILKTHIV